MAQHTNKMKLTTHFETNLYHLTKKNLTVNQHTVKIRKLLYVYMYIYLHRWRWREAPKSEVAREPAKSERVPEERVLSCSVEETSVRGRRRRRLAGQERKRKRGRGRPGGWPAREKREGGEGKRERGPRGRGEKGGVQPAVGPRPKTPLVMWYICHITKFLIKKKGTNYYNKNNVFCKIFPTLTIQT